MNFLRITVLENRKTNTIAIHEKVEWYQLKLKLGKVIKDGLDMSNGGLTINQCDSGIIVTWKEQKEKGDKLLCG